MPNRATLLTGPDALGPRHPLQRHPPRLGRQHLRAPLRHAGYRTGLVGKAHFQNMGAVAELTAFVRQGLAEPDATVRPRPDGWERLEDEARYRAGPVGLPTTSTASSTSS